MPPRHAVLWGVLLALTMAAAPALPQTVSDVAASPVVWLSIVAALMAALLVVALVSLWRSHRLYTDTVRLQQTLIETQQLVLSQWSESPQEQSVASALQPLDAAAQPAPAARTVQPAQVLDALSDVECAVLEKLAADPGYFTQHSLQSFGASQATIDGLLRRGVAKLDGLGRPAVPAEVQAALRARLA